MEIAERVGSKVSVFEGNGLLAAIRYLLNSICHQSALLGPAARLCVEAHGRMRLARLPAGTLQVLGPNRHFSIISRQGRHRPSTAIYSCIHGFLVHRVGFEEKSHELLPPRRVLLLKLTPLKENLGANRRCVNLNKRWKIFVKHILHRPLEEAEVSSWRGAATGVEACCHGQ